MSALYQIRKKIKIPSPCGLITRPGNKKVAEDLNLLTVNKMVNFTVKCNNK